MGFLGLYSGTEKIDVAPGYWVEVKKFLTNADYSEAQKALVVRPHIKGGENGQTVEGGIESESYMQVVVLRGTVAWNLTDENDADLPITIESIERIPQPIFLKVYTRISELNNESDLPVAPGASAREVAKAEAKFPGKAGARGTA